MSDKKDRPHCYLDHANKRSENYAANPYLFWLNQVRRQRSRRRNDEHTQEIVQKRSAES